MGEEGDERPQAGEGPGEDSPARHDELLDPGGRAPEEVCEVAAAPAGIAAWSVGALGTAIGGSGIAAGQQGAAMELYVGGSIDTFAGNNIWSALRYSAASGGFEQVYVSERLPVDIERVALARSCSGRTSSWRCPAGRCGATTSGRNACARSRRTPAPRGVACSRWSPPT